MPAPKRHGLEDFYAQLSDAQRPHLLKLRELSVAAAPQACEELKWNQPAFTIDGVRLWMLQSFKSHCSLRFPLRIVGEHREQIDAAGVEAGEGFLKLPYDHELPVETINLLLKARLDEFEGSGRGWD